MDEYNDKMDELVKLPVNIALEEMMDYTTSVKVIGVNCNKSKRGVSKEKK